MVRTSRGFHQHVNVGQYFRLSTRYRVKKTVLSRCATTNCENFTSKALRDVFHDVSIEPSLQILSGNESLSKATNKDDEARLDVAARGFWVTGQKAFFDIRVFNPLGTVI